MPSNRGLYRSRETQVAMPKAEIPRDTRFGACDLATEVFTPYRPPLWQGSGAKLPGVPSANSVDLRVPSSKNNAESLSEGGMWHMCIRECADAGNGRVGGDGGHLRPGAGNW